MTDFMFESVYPALKERQIPDELRPSCYMDGEQELPQDPLVVWVLGFSVGYREAIRDSGSGQALEDLGRQLEAVCREREKAAGINQPTRRPWWKRLFNRRWQ